jgi:hypothetical protein
MIISLENANNAHGNRFELERKLFFVRAPSNDNIVQNRGSENKSKSCGQHGKASRHHSPGIISPFEDEPGPRVLARGPFAPRSLRPTAVIKPCHYIKPMDPNHPNMRTYIDADRAHTANLLPENSFWKDCDSQVTWALSISFLLRFQLFRNFQAEEEHPNALVLRRMQMNDSEISDHIWDALKGYVQQCARGS